MEQPPGQVSNRLRSLLDRATIERIWPEHVRVLDQSWKEEGMLFTKQTFAIFLVESDSLLTTCSLFGS